MKDKIYYGDNDEKSPDAFIEFGKCLFKLEIHIDSVLEENRSFDFTAFGKRLVSPDKTLQLTDPDMYKRMKRSFIRAVIEAFVEDKLNSVFESDEDTDVSTVLDFSEAFRLASGDRPSLNVSEPYVVDKEQQEKENKLQWAEDAVRDKERLILWNSMAAPREEYTISSKEIRAEYGAALRTMKRAKQMIVKMAKRL